MAFSCIASMIPCLKGRVNSSSVYPEMTEEEDSIARICSHFRSTLPEDVADKVTEFLLANGRRLFDEASKVPFGCIVASKKDTGLPVTIRCRSGGIFQEDEIQIPGQKIGESAQKKIKELHLFTERGAAVIAEASPIPSTNPAENFLVPLQNGVDTSELLVRKKVPHILEMKQAFYYGREGRWKQRIHMERCQCDFLAFTQTLSLQPHSESVVEGLLGKVKDILRGLQGMHECGVCYLDMKPENVLIRQGNEEVLLTDFDFSVRRNKWITPCGTIGFAGPEILFAEGEIRASPAIDMWAFGVLMLQTLLGFNPFNVIENEYLQTYRKGQQLCEDKKYVQRCLQTIREFLLKAGNPVFECIALLLSENPEDRPSASEALHRLEHVDPISEEFVLLATVARQELDPDVLRDQLGKVP